MDDTLAALIDDLCHVDKNIRARATVSLGTLGDPAATAALVQALGVEREFFVREYLTWALVRMGDAAVLPLIQLLKDGDARARHASHDRGAARRGPVGGHQGSLCTG